MGWNLAPNPARKLILIINLITVKTYKRTALLLFKHCKGNLLDHENKELQEWLDESQENRNLFNRLTKNENIEKIGTTDMETVWKIIIPPTSL
jgi:hypothetical protein